MRSQPKHGSGDDAIGPGRRGLRTMTDASTPRSAAGLTPSGMVASKDSLPWITARPLTFTLLGLALAVVFWGLEYKISLYHPHPNHSARVVVAKLWVGPRSAAFTKNSSVRKCAAHPPELLRSTRSRVNEIGPNHGIQCQEIKSIPGADPLSEQRVPRAPPLV